MVSWWLQRSGKHYGFGAIMVAWIAVLQVIIKYQIELCAATGFCKGQGGRVPFKA